MEMINAHSGGVGASSIVQGAQLGDFAGAWQVLSL
jgi:hypothetical protein